MDHSLAFLVTPRLLTDQDVLDRMKTDGEFYGLLEIKPGEIDQDNVLYRQLMRARARAHELNEALHELYEIAQLRGFNTDGI